MDHIPPFQYRPLGDFTYHVLNDPDTIKSHLLKWILREWEMDHDEAPHEHWTVGWVQVLPNMQFSLEIIRLDDIHLHPDLMAVDEFRASLQVRADEREWSILRGSSIEPLLVNRNGYQLMDGYTRYAVLQRYRQSEIYAYMGRA